jgi:superoxide dismutase
MTKLILVTTSLIIFGTFKLQAQINYDLPQLPFAYESLEPHIDKETMMIHHTKHHQGYINNLKTALAGKEVPNSLDELMKNVSKYSVAVRNNGGGHYNHSLFWSILTPSTTTKPSKRLHEAIVTQFGGMDSLKLLLNNAAMKQFGSGWAWLCVDENKKLFISSTPNQDNPLMDVVEKQGVPLIGIDVWEHAYYLKYQNKRGDYLGAIWNLIDWGVVSEKYISALNDPLLAQIEKDNWPELKEFHRVMSQTFHPSETGNLSPLRNRSGELLAKAILLKNSVIPSPFSNPKITEALSKLEKECSEIHKLNVKKTKDEVLKKKIAEAHDTFHVVQGLCHD